MNNLKHRVINLVKDKISPNEMKDYDEPICWKDVVSELENDPLTMEKLRNFYKNPNIYSSELQAHIDKCAGRVIMRVINIKLPKNYKSNRGI